MNTLQPINKIVRPIAIFASVMALISGCSTQSPKPPSTQPSPSTISKPNPNMTPEESGANKAEPQRSVTPKEMVSVKNQTNTPVAKKEVYAPTAPSTKTIKKEPVSTAKPKEQTKARAKAQPAKKSVAKTKMPPKPRASVPVNEKAITPQPYAFKIDELPITMKGGWQLDRTQDYCVLRGQEISMLDGQGTTQVKIQLMPNQWSVITDSDIDLSYPNVGITTDTGQQLLLGKVMDETIALVTSDFDLATKALLGAQKITIALGFWPTWPVTDTQTLTLTMEHFPAAYLTWQECQKKLVSER